MRKPSSAIIAKNKFIEMLNTNVYKAGDKLPSEPQMAENLCVSRETWRNALKLLRKEHYIDSKHGVGSFLLERPHKIPNDLSSLRSLTEMIKTSDIKENSSKIEVHKQLPDIATANKLQISESDEIVVLSRVRYCDKKVISSSINYIPLEYGKEIAEGNFYSSLFKYFENLVGITISRSTTEIVVPNITNLIAKPLFDSNATSIIGLQQLHYDTKGNRIMYSLDYLNCEYFDFSVTRIREI